MALLRNVSASRKTPAQLFALWAGATYFLVGLLGLALTHLDLTSLPGSSATIAVFAVNVLHSLLHLAVGVAWIVAAQSRSWARTTNLMLGIAYALLAVLGFSGMLQFLSIGNWIDPDNILHLATAVSSIYFSSLGARRRSSLGLSTAA
jgi:hypothetical protein